uniref:Prenyltransferase alpha-alpha toroid domain-containing protein n=1 Tax=Ciona savignyi TaxID=51511 RepID=H2YT30_CIOSA
FERKKHIRFFTRILQILPSRYAILDTSRLTVAFFALSGLGVLDALDAIPDKDKQEIIEWIYTLQVVGNKAKSSAFNCVFNCRDIIYFSFCYTESMETTNNYDCSHIAMTYTGLASLLILGDDLRRVNKHACLEGIKALQLPDGSFKSSYDGSENDMRFIYCACCVCTMLDDFSAINQATATNFIMKSLILGIFDLVDFKENENFVLSTQDIIVGGFAKWPQINPDALHSYMGVCGLALMSLHSLQPVDPTLNISERARLHMQTLHEQWAVARKHKEAVSRVRTKS